LRLMNTEISIDKIRQYAEVLGTCERRLLQAGEEIEAAINRQKQQPQESSAQVVAGLIKVRNRLEEEAHQTGKLQRALESICEIYQSCEERVADHVQSGVKPQTVFRNTDISWIREVAAKLG